MNSKLLFGFIASVLVSQPVIAGMLSSTTDNIGKPYQVIDGACVYSQASGLSFKGDPIELAIAKAFEKMEALAAKTGADALVGFDIDFANRTQKDEGRVVLCGTLVKFK
ncbi:hypothetical protein ACFL3I_03735 [Pseudomonadota bacterium]